MLWLIPLIVFGPPAAFALFRPRTPTWRRARRVHWIVLPVMLGVFVFNLLAIDPAGPAAVYYGAWGVFVVVAAVYCYAVAVIRAEWSKYNKIHSVKPARGDDRGP